MSLRAVGLGLLLIAPCSVRLPAQGLPPARQVLPVLDFPEPGLDDTASYQGYQTRFYRDSKQNTVQVYLEPKRRTGSNLVGRCRQRERRVHRARRRRPLASLDLGSPGG